MSFRVDSKDGVVTLTVSFDALSPATVQVTSSLHAQRTSRLILEEGPEQLVLEAPLEVLRDLCEGAAESASKLEAHLNPSRVRESMRVVNFADGTMEITARVRAPEPRMDEFFVKGYEAVKRYQKWVVLTAASMLHRDLPKVLVVALRYVENLGPDSENDG